jgi:FlaA1/EpsC-like NDP-sugar epimerase
MDWVLCIVLLSAIRLFPRILYEYLTRQKGIGVNTKKILIIGAGYAGVMLLGEYLRNPTMGVVSGFIDDDPVKLHEQLQGVKVMGARRDIPRVVEELDIAEIILAVPSASGEEIRAILSYCEQTSAKIKVVPGLEKIISGEMEVKPREVRPEDLLGRATVHINTDMISGYLNGKVVLVTGAGGSIGSEICRQVASFKPKKIILFDHHENYVYFLTIEFKTKYPHLDISTVIGDVRDIGLLKRIFTIHKPQVVFHAAAHKHVPLMEENPVAAVKNNIIGSRHMIYAAHHYQVERFVLISTDKAVNPINIMGMSKRIAEIILQQKAKKSKTKFMAVRFGNVLGSAGSVVPLFKRQIENGGPVTITHENMKRYFMSIKEAVMLVLEAGSLGQGGELFILDMGEQIKVIEIAKNLIALSGLTLGRDIKIDFIGLRPGEKMEEELLLDKEKDQVTQHNKIYVSSSASQEETPMELNRDLRALHRLTQLMDEKAIVALMKNIIERNS